jgi:hypothetical protein
MVACALSCQQSRSARVDRVRPAEQLGGASSVSFHLPREKLRRLNAIDRVGKLGGDLLVTLERNLSRSPRNGLHHFCAAFSPRFFARATSR